MPRKIVLVVHGVGPFDACQVRRSCEHFLPLYAPEAQLQFFNWDALVDRPLTEAGVKAGALSELALAFISSSELGFHGRKAAYLNNSVVHRSAANWAAFLFRIGAMLVVPVCLAAILLPSRHTIALWVAFQLTVAILAVGFGGSAVMPSIRRIALAGFWPLVHFLGGLFLARRVAGIVLGILAFAVTTILSEAIFGDSDGWYFAVSTSVRMGFAIAVGYLFAAVAFTLKVACDIFRYIGSESYRNSLLDHWHRHLDQLSLMPADELILVAHSLGSVIAVEGLLTCGPGCLPSHLVLITMGSPLRRLFWRFFRPLFPSPAATACALANRIGDFRWCNIYRPFDVIGSRLGAQSITDQTTGELLKNHTNYWADRIVWNLVTSYVKNGSRRSIQSAADDVSFWPVASRELDDPGLIRRIWNLRGPIVGAAFYSVSCAIVWTASRAFARYSLYGSLIAANETAMSIMATSIFDAFGLVAFFWLCSDGISYALTLGASQRTTTPVAWIWRHAGVAVVGSVFLVIVGAVSYTAASHPLRWPEAARAMPVDAVGGLEGGDLAYFIDGTRLAFNSLGNRIAFANPHANVATYWSISRDGLHPAGTYRLKLSSQAATFDDNLRLFYSDDDGALNRVDSPAATATQILPGLTMDVVSAAAVTGSPPCTLIAVDRTITTQCASGIQHPCSITGFAAHVNASADGHTAAIISPDGGLRIIDTGTCNVLTTLPAHAVANHTGTPGIAQLSSGGTYAIAGPYAAGVWIWTRPSNTWQRLDTPKLKALEAVAFSSDSRCAAVGFLRGVIAVFRTTDFSLVAQTEDYNLGATLALAFSADNQLLAAVTEYRNDMAVRDPIATAFMKLASGAALHLWRLEPSSAWQWVR